VSTAVGALFVALAFAWVFAFGAAPDDRSWLAGLINEAISALIAMTAVLGAIILIVAQSGPLIAPNVRLYAFVGFVLALRAIIRLFVRNQW
jgi:ubiquinone biosynthesis protein